MAFSFLWNWWQRSPRLDHLRVVLYTRQGCHLCETAEEELRLAQRRCHFQLETVDVDSDPALHARYGEQVPVVTVAGKVRFTGTVNRVLLTRLLHAEAERKRSEPTERSPDR